ncbi:MAG: tRNA (guanosine(37)-N1)-methyltransferase TrmD [Terracidiphilus sp.]|jgi:tRNA (guanine37-N1)-methyltransferase
MRFEIVTIFPEFFTSIFENGILRRALAEGLVTVGVHDLRAFTHDRHRTVDDRPFGGGEGMVLKPEPLAEALASLGVQPKTRRQEGPQAAGSIPTEGGGGFNPRIEPTDSTQALAPEKRFALKGHDFSRAIRAAQSTGALAPEGELSEQSPSRPRVILLSAQGRPFTQALARELAATERVVLVCGRYEGVDERINQLYCDMELSIGDYVLSGGELAAAVVVDATMRLVPGVLGNEASGDFESFGVDDAEIAAAEDGVPRSQHGAGGLLDYPHYTRPAEFGGLRVPETLLNGDHAEIRRWRREQQLRKTLANRPGLLERAALSKEDRKLLETIRDESA